MKKLVKISIDCGRMGSLEALEIYDEQDWENLLKAQKAGLSIYCGDILGKHSEFNVELSFSDEEFRIVSEEQDKIDWLQKIFETKDIVGNFGVRDRLEDLLDEYSYNQDNQENE